MQFNNSKKKVTFEIPDEEYEILEKLCKETTRSKANMIRYLINQENKKKKREENSNVKV
jgi:predicted DNA-binding protein